MNGQHSAQPGPSSRIVQQGHSSSSYTIPLYDTSALTAALSNPYAQQYAQHNISPHYYQAYVQAYNNRAPLTTPEGYTLSSTYVPGKRTTQVPLTTHAPSRQDRGPAQTQAQTNTTRTITNPLTYGSWYQPGNCQCTRQGCPFTGSRKSVEIHMMDRHLIYPHEWGKSKKDDWDTDPSLKGKPIAIQGTSLILDTPEAVNGWIEERKKRFPTAEKVEEKKRKLGEAAARGELAPEDIGLGARKRQRQDNTSTDGSVRGFRSQGHRGGRGRGRGRGRARGGPVERELPRSENVEATSLIDAKPVYKREDSPGSASGDEGPEVLSSKVCVEPLPTTLVENGEVGETRTPQARHRERTRNVPQPKKPPRNPFASRPTLLRNLLLPEIRITISNLSQAIHFLVDNDFLREVELRPGEAQEKMIEVLESSETVERSSFSMDSV